MCGFTLYLHTDATTKNQDDQFPVLDLEGCLDLINHRGPDARGIYTSPDGRCGLGHARLSILDLAGGQQPLSSQCDKVHAVVNGELYDHDRLSRQLKEKGHIFNTESDSEMVLHFYEDHDTDFLEYLRGEFAVAIWDERKGRLMLVRDRFGIKPVYYTTVNGTFMAASEIKAFLALGWKPEWDVDSIVHHGAASDFRTCFRNVYKLPPAHYLTINLSGSVSVNAYWEIEYPNKNVQDTRTVDEMIQGVRDHIIEATRLRQRSDVPVGILLSGGIDSSSIAGVMAHVLRDKNTQTKTDAFCISFTDGNEFDEGDVAERTAAFCDINLHRIPVTSQDMVDVFPDTIWHIEQPLFILSATAVYLLAKYCHESGIKVVMSGQGSDEHFLGYQFFHHPYLLEADNSTPGGFGRPTEENRKKLLKKNSEGAFIMGTYVKLSGNASTAHRWNGVTTQDGFQELFGFPSTAFMDKVIQDCGPPDVSSAIMETIDSTTRHKIRKDWHPVHTSQYLANRIFLSNILLNIHGDRVELAHSLEVRTPFLDHHFCEYVNSLPPSVKIRGDGEKLNEKWILKEAMKPFITEEMYNRTKHTFAPPPAILTREKATPYKQLMDMYLTKESVDGLGWAHWPSIEKQRNLFMETADTGASKVILMIISYIIIGNKFGVAKAIV